MFKKIIITAGLLVALAAPAFGDGWHYVRQARQAQQQEYRMEQQRQEAMARQQEAMEQQRQRYEDKRRQAERRIIESWNDQRSHQRSKASWE